MFVQKPLHNGLWPVFASHQVVCGVASFAHSLLWAAAQRRFVAYSDPYHRRLAVVMQCFFNSRFLRGSPTPTL